MTTCEERYACAQRILHEKGLLDRLAQIGTPHIIGSFRMNMMAWNDLDIDIENDHMSLDKLYELSTWIQRSFHPTWYEAKEESNSEGKTVWFHGFEAVIEEEKWNIDLWFFDRETICKAEAYCDRIKKRIEEQSGARDAILDIKQELIKRGRYGFYDYASMDVYRAVLEQDICTADEMLARYIKQENRID